VTKLFTAKDFRGVIQESVYTDDSAWGSEQIAETVNTKLQPLVDALEQWFVAIRREGVGAPPSEDFLRVENGLFLAFRALAHPKKPETEKS